ncbi:MAG: hypothetical protein J6D10_07200 [Clostridia bacterium]|nr:hypothetical protein [Clostridia bacterium]
MFRERILRSRLVQECREYSYEKCVGDDEIRSLLFTFRQDFPEQTAAVLIAGCVKLNAVLYQKDGRIHLGYDLYVKDSPGSAEWIFYEALCDTEDVSELSMLKILDHAVKEHGLSYTECCFERLDGVKIVPESK